MCSLGIEPTTFRSADAMFYHWATQEHKLQYLDTPILVPILMLASEKGMKHWTESAELLSL